MTEGGWKGIFHYSWLVYVFLLNWVRSLAKESMKEVLCWDTKSLCDVWWIDLCPHLHEHGFSPWLLFFGLKEKSHEFFFLIAVKHWIKTVLVFEVSNLDMDFIKFDSFKIIQWFACKKNTSNSFLVNLAAQNFIILYMLLIDYDRCFTSPNSLYIYISK